MPFHWSSVWIATAGALVLGLALAWLLAVRNISAISLALAPLFVVPVVIVAALRAHRFVPLAAVLSGLPFIVILCAIEFRNIGTAFGNGARSLGASEWRIFWRILVPMGWKAILVGSALAFARIAAESAIAANL